MKKDLNTTRPNESAIPTSKGWEDPQTGELLVAIKNLQEKLKEDLTTTAKTNTIPQKRTPGRPKGSKNKKTQKEKNKNV